MIPFLLVTLILLNNTTYPGGYIDLKVVNGEENVNMSLTDKCMYFYGYNKSEIPAKSGYYKIYVSYLCKPGNKSIVVDGNYYNFTVLKPDYNYLLESAIKLEREIKILREKIESLKTKNKELVENISKLELENRNLIIKVQNISNELKYYKDLVEDLKESNQKLEDEKAKLLANLTNLTNLVESLKRDKASLSSILRYLELFGLFTIAFIVGSYLAIITKRR